MPKNGRVSIATLLTLIAIGALLAPRFAWAAIEHYDLTVKGLACPFCVYGVEKKLKALPGVRNVKVDLESGRATFDVSGEEALMPQRVRNAVKQAGFTPSDDITITASGRLEPTKGELRLRVDRDDAVNIVGGKEIERARAAARERKSVIVTGIIKRVGDREVLSAGSVRWRERK